MGSGVSESLAQLPERFFTPKLIKRAVSVGLWERHSALNKTLQRAYDMRKGHKSCVGE